MAIEAANWYTIQYDQRVSHIIQNEGFLLKGTTKAPVNVKGNTLEFFFMGKAEVTPFGPTPEFAKPANLAKTTKTVDMTDWQFYEEIRHGEPEKISPEYRAEIQQASAYAMGRKFDRIIMEAMDAEAGAIATIGDGTAAITPMDTSTARAKIAALGPVKLNNFFCPLPTMSMEQLKLYQVFNNADYTGPQLAFMQQSDARTWNRINFFEMPDDAFTAYDTHSVDTYLWHADFLGFGSNYAMQTKITYENMKTAWAYNTVMSGAAKVLQPEGVRRLRIKIDAPLLIDGAA